MDFPSRCLAHPVVTSGNVLFDCEENQYTPDPVLNPAKGYGLVQNEVYFCSIENFFADVDEREVFEPVLTVDKFKGLLIETLNLHINYSLMDPKLLYQWFYLVLSIFKYYKQFIYID